MSQSDEFEAISETQLIDLISSDDLETESGDEEEVFRAVMKWAENSQGTVMVNDNIGACSVSWPGSESASFRGPRASSLHHVLYHVRLPMVSPYFLHDCVATQR